MRAWMAGWATALLASTGAAAETQAVPPTRSTFDAEALEARDLFDTSGIGRLGVPLLTGTALALDGTANSVFLRGVGSLDRFDADSPVPLLLDGIRLGRLTGSQLGLFPGTALVVARGTQGPTGPLGATGGALALGLATPAERFGGSVAASLGSFGLRRVRAAVDMPVDPALGLHFAGIWQESRGFARNSVTGEALNDRDHAGVRLAARLRPARGLTWDTGIAYTETDGENLPSFRCDPLAIAGSGAGYITTGLLAGRRPGGAPQYTLPVTGPKARQVLGSRSAATLLTSRLAWDTPTLRLELVSGYLDATDGSALDARDGRGAPGSLLPDPPVRGFVNGGLTEIADTGRRQWSHDLRATARLLDGRLGFVAGALVADEHAATDLATLETRENGTTEGVPAVLADRRFEVHRHSSAAYAEADLALTDRLGLLAGLRVSTERTSADVRDNRPDCAPGACLSADFTSSGTRRTTTAWTPSLGVAFRPSADLLLFARSTKGVRPAGFDLDGLAPETLRATDAETAWTHEAGVRTALLDGRLRVAAVAFALDVTSALVPQQVSGTDLVATGNGADFRNRGLELELAATPVPGLTLDLAAGFQQARWRTAASAPGLVAIEAQQAACRAAPGGAACATGLVDAAGDLATPPHAPDWTLALGATGDLDVPEAGIRLAPAIRLGWRSAIATGFADAPLADAAWQLDTTLAILTPDGGWRLAIGCANCLDTRTPDAAAGPLAIRATPRQLFFNARRRF